MNIDPLSLLPEKSSMFLLEICQHLSFAFSFFKNFFFFYYKLTHHSLFKQLPCAHFSSIYTQTAPLFGCFQPFAMTGNTVVEKHIHHPPG